MNALPLFPECRRRKPRYTKAFRFTPQSLVELARTDLARKLANSRIAARSPSDFYRLGFYPEDVRLGETVCEVLRRALKRARRKSVRKPSGARSSAPNRGWRESASQHTRTALYGDIRALKSALRIAERA
ncbi:MAG: hypothetical protein KGL39_49050 [Patescibacteria group bacterium]|nr:hypothetical protein [Patescibacteria group bacterium]